MQAHEQTSSKDYCAQDHSGIVITLPEQIANAFGVTYFIFWGLGGLIYLSALILISWKENDFALEIMWPIITIGILPPAMLILGIYLSKRLCAFTPSLLSFIREDPETAYQWYSRQLRGVFSDIGTTITGLLVAVPIFFYARGFDFAQEDTLTQRIFVIASTAAAFTGGSLYYVRVRFSMLILQLDKSKKIHISISQHPMASITGIGQIMAHVSMASLILYLIGISSLYTMAIDIRGWFLVLAFAVMELALFIIPQLQVHQRMVYVKRQKILDFSKHMEKILRETMETPTPDYIARLRELSDVQKTLNDMNEWPFNTKEFILIISGVIIPVVGILKEIFSLKAS